MCPLICGVREPRTSSSIITCKKNNKQTKNTLMVFFPPLFIVIFADLCVPLSFHFTFMACSSSSKLSVKIREKCHVSPCVGESYSLPLTFLDIPWLLFPPSQPLFFFQLPPTSSPSFFSSVVVPRLRFSLSSALEYFSPFAARVAASQDSNRIKFVFGETASPLVPVTIAECDDAQFEYLCRDICQKNANDLHQLVPNLLSLRSSCGLDNLTPLLAIQVTYFPLGHGFSIGLAYHRVVSDQRTFNNFMHSWASLCKHGELPPGLEPTFDRAVVLDPNGLEPILLNQFWESEPGSIIPAPGTMCLGLVRSTFVMGPAVIAKAEQWILAECQRKNRPYPVLLSPYVVTCAFIWACLVRAQSQGLAQTRIHKGPMYFGFIAGGITRLRYRVPGNYFGNCVAFGRAIAQREELLGNDGVLVAADAIGQTIKKLDRDVLDEAGNCISDWEPIVGSDLHVNMVGSPKVDLYEVDFGWGKPKKIEENSIDVMRGISLTESRQMKGGIEIGMALPKSTMDAFSCLFTQGLRDFSF